MKAIFLIVAVTISLAGKACPFCNSKTAREIRASLFGADFLFNLSVTLLPFIIFSAIACFIYYGGFPVKQPRIIITMKP